MSDKRDAAMAGLSWPTSVRSPPNPRTTGSTDSEMTDDIGHESFPATTAAAPPADTSYASSGLNPRSLATSYHHHNDYTHYGPWTPSTTTAWQLPTPTFPRGRTVHTIYFKIWDPDHRHVLCTWRRSTNKDFFVNSTRSISFISSQGINIKPTRCRTIGAHTMAFL